MRCRNGSLLTMATTSQWIPELPMSSRLPSASATWRSLPLCLAWMRITSHGARNQSFPCTPSFSTPGESSMMVGPSREALPPAGLILQTGRQPPRTSYGILGKWIFLLCLSFLVWKMGAIILPISLAFLPKYHLRFDCGALCDTLNREMVERWQAVSVIIYFSP